MQIAVNGVVRSGRDALDYAISGLEIIQNDAGTYLVSASGPYGGIASYELTADSPARHVDCAFFNPSWAAGILDGLALVCTPDGTSRAVVGTDSDNDLMSYVLDDTGEIGALSHIETGADSLHCDGALAAVESDRLMVGDADGGFACFSVGGPDAELAFRVGGDETGPHCNVSAFTSVSVGESSFMVVATDGNCAVSVIDASGDAAVVTDTSGADDGIGLMSPTAIATAQVDGQTYVLVASAREMDGALSVFRVSADGRLTSTDHILDTRASRFGGVQDMEVVSVDGRCFVVAGGADDGLSVFTLLPGGQLQHLSSIADTTSIGLTNLSEIALAHVGDEIRILVGSQSEGMLTDLSLRLDGGGENFVAGESGVEHTAGAGHDVLVGGAGNDTLSGGAGDDILVDGAGRDRLSGNAGADLFVLREDGAEDFIFDFDTRHDRIDLTSWPMIYDAGSLRISETRVGAEIIWRDEKLMVRSHDLTPIPVEEMKKVIRFDVNRPIDLSGMEFPEEPSPDPEEEPSPDSEEEPSPDPEEEPSPDPEEEPSPDPEEEPSPDPEEEPSPDSEEEPSPDPEEEPSPDPEEELSFDLSGTDTNDTLTGSESGESISGLSGHDTVFAGSGDDEIYGDTGDDKLYGGDGNDHLFGGDGNDQLLGDSDDDVLNGGDGDDTLEGGDGNDTLNGGDGVDHLEGQGGDDKLSGGDCNDILSGGTGADTLSGDAGNDSLDGGVGNDRLFGGQGRDKVKGGDGDDVILGGDDADRLDGNNGHDVLEGGDGNDRLRGGSGNDTLQGGLGNDKLIGHAGKDKVDGGSGNDLLMGNGGADKLYGQDGADELRGNGGRDYLNGGAGDDKLLGGKGNDKLWGQDGNDRLFGGGGSDMLNGGLGDDHLEATSGKRNRLYGGRGDDVLIGGKSGDRLFGGDGADNLSGGAGRDRMIGGMDDDILTGGTGRDVFVFSKNSGDDQITDFVQPYDKIEMNGLSESDLSVREQAGSLAVYWDSGSILFEGIAISAFDIDWFDFN